MRSSASVSGSVSGRPGPRPRSGGADLESRADQLLGEGMRTQPRGMPGQVARHLRRGVTSCGGSPRGGRGQHTGQRPPSSIAASDRGRRHQDLRSRRRGVSSPAGRACRLPRASLSSPAASAILASSSVRRTAGSRWPARPGAQVAERQAKLRLELIGPRQQQTPSRPGPYGPADVTSASRTCPRAAQIRARSRRARNWRKEAAFPPSSIRFARSASPRHRGSRRSSARPPWTGSQSTARKC